MCVVVVKKAKHKLVTCSICKENIALKKKSKRAYPIFFEESRLLHKILQAKTLFILLFTFVFKLV